MAAARHKTDQELIRAEYGYPPRKEDFLSLVENDPDAPGVFWVWIEEWTEIYLGTAPFDSLVERFKQIPGVDSAEQEDREVFCIRVHGIAAEKLEQEMWEKFCEAAEEGFRTNAPVL